MGDHVRIRLASIYSNLRARLKAGTAKLNIVRFSPEVYQIVRKFPPPEGQFGFSSYVVEDRNHNVILKGNVPQRFRFNEMILVPFGLTAPNPMNQLTADHLNQVKVSAAPVQQPAPVAAPIVLPPPPTPFDQWEVGDWNRALR